ncbi:MAG: PD40 domain-containing protein [Chitinophagales bacterium]|nr:PD40 domain-containing protein [Chitinophagales bacterium]
MRVSFLLLTLVVLAGCNQQATTESTTTGVDSSTVHFAEEKHLKNVRQLTFSGENAEAYWSFDNTMLTFQRTNKNAGIPCDQIFYGEVESFLSSAKSGNNNAFGSLVSTGKGRTTCSFFMPDNKHVLYASTHLKADSCPPVLPHQHGKYLWQLYPEFEIFIADLNGNIVKQLTNNDYYDAEAVVSPNGDKILFTSTRSGDLELYTMNLDGSDVKQITNELGYDGGANFSPDGSQIVWRASRFDTEEEREEYRQNLKKDLVSPMKMELFIANTDGSNRRKLTDLGAANWAPFFHPSGNKVVFSSNHKTKSIPFNLYMINTDGTGLEQITFDNVFDAFPMFSYDGKKLAWCSNRNNGGTRETNIFIADWVE